MEKREIKMGSVQAFLILRSIISVSPGIAGRRTYVCRKAKEKHP